VALAGVWLDFRAAIAPVRERERQVRAETASLREQISDVRKTVQEIHGLEIRSASERGELNRSDSEFPAGSPVVWIPGLVKRHFGRFGFAELNTEMKDALDEPEFPEYQRIHWSTYVVLPMRDAARQIGALLLAVAELEQTERIVRLVDIAVETDADERGPRTAVITFSTLLRK
jgi:hypothetical protein